ncbi:chemotaxis protein CheA [Chitinilyticum litopenaei]|uniref:chemotaxis protein CheA n=1 Tax=Chitinilyticum litopenaei TaxID=1121276 RepID=UPI00040EC058|nr:chemotaxis protein CheA [Chitinilyticum litopenaei]
MNLDQAMQAFFDEAFELLQQMEAILLDAESTQSDPELLNALFRTIHTIKGSAGLFALDDIVGFTHQVENVLDRLRGGELALTETLTSLLLRCHDHVKAMLQALASHGTAPDATLGHALLAELAGLSGQAGAATPGEPSAEATAAAAHQDWLLYLGFGPDVLRHGLDPASFLSYLATLGHIEQVIPLYSGLNAVSDYDPEQNYLQLALRFAGHCDLATLHDVFEFAREDSHILIAPLADAARQLADAGGALPEAELQQARQSWLALGMMEGGKVAHAADQGMAAKIETVAGTPPPGTGDPAASPVAASKKVKANERAGESRFLRVEAEKLDNLINLIGELVIAGAAGNLLAQQTGSTALQEWNQGVSGLIEQIRTGALSMRMVQVGEIFNRFPRVVRDVSKELGKEIELKISGADAELDKTMVEKLGDPLMHIVRNAMDHGIEGTELRRLRGKPAQGTVRLNAYHESGSIVIEISDDGGGLNREKILKKAIDRSLIAPDAQLADQEIYALIFEPGFSTADQITNISGRGVGMDVVRRSIEALRGIISIDSELEVGTVFRIRLPLTLAIIDGFMVQAGDAIFIVPLESIVECVELPEEQSGNNSCDHLNLRNELLPLLRLATFFELPHPTPPRQNVVILQLGDRKAGLVVDRLLGEFQTVIKPLGSMFRSLKPIGGSTILGNGQVALILDVNELVTHVINRDAVKYSLAADQAHLGSAQAKPQHMRQ